MTADEMPWSRPSMPWVAERVADYRRTTTLHEAEAAEVAALQARERTEAINAMRGIIIGFVLTVAGVVAVFGLAGVGALIFGGQN